MADYFAMNHDELTAEKAALEAQYKKFQDMGLKLNMARGKPGPHQMDLAMDLLKMDNYITDNGLTPATTVTWRVSREPARCLPMCSACSPARFSWAATQPAADVQPGRHRHDVRLS